MDWYVDRGMPTALTELRREVKAQLARHSDASPDDLADAELIAAELLANAVDHSQGPIWVSLEWSGPRPTLSVHDMGKLFTLPVAAPDVAQPRGRGLWMVSQLAPELSIAGRRAGKTVKATLPVTRPVQRSVDLPRRTVNPLPRLEEADAEGGFGRESFLRALVVQLASAVEDQQGPDAAQRAVAQVAADIGGQMEHEYRQAMGMADRPLTVEEIAQCLVRLKAAIGGTFRVVEVAPERIVLVNSHCPFGPEVQHSPSLCRMTSAVFGGIAARNANHAAVSLDERIAIGDSGCRVVVHLDEAAKSAQQTHHYTAGTTGMRFPVRSAKSAPIPSTGSRPKQ